MMPMNVHFVGIGGIGISALARFYLSFGSRVAGSDMSPSALVSELRKEGIKIYIGHKASYVAPSTDLVIYSAAIPSSNPELARARELRKDIRSYAEAVGDLTRQYFTFAVAGAHGKSTTTSLLALALVRAGLDPTVIVGTKLKEFGNSNFRKGKSKYLVLEADEYNKSFLHHSPSAAIITNIDREHLDTYKNLSNIKRAFLKFAGNVRKGGVLVVNYDDKNTRSIAKELKKIAEGRRLTLVWYSLKDFHGQFKMKVPGTHNVSNALSVLALINSMKIQKKPAIKALESYKGAWRRMEYRGNLKIQNSKFKIHVYDDYAHHPTEIRATLLAFRGKYPRAQIVCVFQPHQAQRLKKLFREFVSAFDDADALILLGIYKVSGRDRTYHNYTAKDLAEKIQTRLLKNKKLKLKTGNVVYLPSPAHLGRTISKILQALKANETNKLKAIIIMMGAGDIVKYTDKIIYKP